jgi:hypothetical protein
MVEHPTPEGGVWFRIAGALEFKRIGLLNGRRLAGRVSLLVAALALGGAALAAQDAGAAADGAQRTLDRLREIEAERATLLEGLSPEERERVLQALAAGGDLAPPLPVSPPPARADALPARRESEAEIADEAPEQAVVSPKPEPTAPAPEAVASAEPPAAPPVSLVSEAQASSTGARCRALAPLDTSEDDQLSGSDRYWRHLYLWHDDGDGEIAEREVTSVFEEGVRKIALDLGRYTTAGGDNGAIDITATRVRFDLPGRSRAESVLVIDNAGMSRGEGPVFLASGSDPPAPGFTVLTPGGLFRAPSGDSWPLSCLVADEPSPSRPAVRAEQ